MPAILSTPSTLHNCAAAKTHLVARPSNCFMPKLWFHPLNSYILLHSVPVMHYTTYSVTQHCDASYILWLRTKSIYVTLKTLIIVMLGSWLSEDNKSLPIKFDLISHDGCGMGSSCYRKWQFAWLMTACGPMSLLMNSTLPFFLRMYSSYGDPTAYSPFHISYSLQKLTSTIRSYNIKPIPSPNCVDTLQDIRM